MIGFRCVLIFSLILSSTIVTGHSIHRRDSQNDDEGDDDKTKIMLKSFSDMIKMSAQRIKDSFKMGYHFMKSRTSPDETNSTSENLSMGNSSMDEDTIIFNNEDGPDMTPAIMTTIDDNNEKQADATTIPSILNRSLLDTPIACGGGQQLGKDGKCRVVW